MATTGMVMIKSTRCAKKEGNAGISMVLLTRNHNYKEEYKLPDKEHVNAMLL